MRFRLGTLLIVLAIGPPVLAGAWFKYQEYRSRRDLSDLMEAVPNLFIIDDSALLDIDLPRSLDLLPLDD